MAKQNKSRKFVASSATAALVASAIVPVASAAVNDLDTVAPYAQEAVQYLVDNGVVQGDNNGNFNAKNTITRAEAATIFANYFELEAGEENPFTDVKADAWYTDAITGAYAAGLVNGIGENTFGPLKTLTRAEAATLLVRAFKLEGAADLSNFADAEGLAEWKTEALAVAVEYGVITGIEKNGKLYLDADAPITREQFATIFYRTLDATGLIGGVEEVEIVSVSAINTNQVKVEFDGAVDTSKAVITLKKGAVVYNAEVTYSEDKKSAVLKTQINLPAGDYSVTVTGVTEEALTATLKVEAEKVTAIEVASDSVVAVKDSTIKVNVLNQYGTVMNVNGDALTVTAFNVTQNKNVTVKGVAGKKEVQFTNVAGADTTLGNTDDEFKIGDDIRVTVTYQGATAQKVVKAQAASAAATIALGDVSPLPNKARVTTGDAGLVLPYELADQFGKAFKFATRSVDGVDDNTTTMDGVLFTTSNASVVDPDTFAVDSEGKLTFTAGAAGTAKITAIINATGQVASIDVTVNEASALKTLTLSEPSKLVAAGESVEIPFSALDQFDNVLKAADFAGNIKWTSSNNAIVDAATGISFDSKGKLNVTAGSTAGKVTLTATDGAGKTYATVVLDVQAAAAPTSIVGIDAPTALENTATIDVDFADIKVKDQYGRDYKLVDGDVVTVTVKDGTADAVTFGSDLSAGSSSAAFDHTADKVTFTGTATTTSNEVFELALANGATYNFTLASVASSSIVSYEIVDPGTVYAAPTHTVTLDLVGKLANGAKVALKPGKVTAYTSSTVSVATIDSAVLTGVKAGTTTVSAFEGATKLAERVITVSEEAPAETTVKFANAEETVTEGSTDTFVPTVKDQYGKDIAFKGTFATSDKTIATVNAKTGEVTGVAAGIVTISYVSPNGVVATYELTVTN